MMSSNVDMKECFNYLEILRKSGVTNMFGAAPYLEKEFDLDRKTARDVLLSWMCPHSENHKL